MRFRRRRPADVELGPIPDDLPRTGLFAEPLVVERISTPDPEPVDGQHRVAFRLTVKDADGKRCPDIAVEARVSGPTRASAGMGTTDLMGAITFRMTGPEGTYRLDVLDVAAKGLAWDRERSVTDATVTIPPPDL